MEKVKETIQNFLGTWEDNGILPNLPKLEQGGKYKGFLFLMCRKMPNPFYVEGIIALDDNLHPKGLIGYVCDIRFKTEENVKEEEFRIEKLDTKLSAYLYTSDKYFFSFNVNKDLWYYDWCDITITKK
jgi:hypothetical protein